MTKDELVEAISADAKLSKKVAEAALDSFCAHVGAALYTGETISLRGFGTFATKYQAARIARNPRTGESIEVEPTVKATFRAGVGLRERLHARAAELQPPTTAAAA